jgi:lipid A disaccharide synthetase
LIVCHYITLPNLFADRDIMPEFPFAGDPAPYIKKMTEILSGWLGDRQTLFAKVAELKHLRDQFGQTGATQRTAETILNHLSASEQRCAA